MTFFSQDLKLRVPCRLLKVPVLGVAVNLGHGSICHGFHVNTAKVLSTPMLQDTPASSLQVFGLFHLPPFLVRSFQM